jgi:hypothetical protein
MVTPVGGIGFGKGGYSDDKEKAGPTLTLPVIFSSCKFREIA